MNKHEFLKKSNGLPFIDHWWASIEKTKTEILSEEQLLNQASYKFCKLLNLTIVSDHLHYFGPGISYVIVLAESHLSIHTWPEINYLYLDIVTCVPRLNKDNLSDAIERSFGSQNYEFSRIGF